MQHQSLMVYGVHAAAGDVQQRQQQRADPTPQIFIGRVPRGLPLSTLEAQLVPFGATNVRMLEGKGCAFADFDTWAAAERAVFSLNGMKLTEGVAEGINVKLADQKGAPKGREGQPKVFIGGLAPGVTEDSVFQVCAAFGSVQESKIFSKSASRPPCAFVTFATFTEAESCISALNGQEHEFCSPGKTLNARLADSTQSKSGSIIGGAIVGGGGACSPSRVGMAAPRGAVGPRGAMMAATMAGGSLMQLPSAAGGARQQVVTGGCGGMMGGRPSGGGGPAPTGASEKIFIGNLPELATEDFIWGMMAPFGEVVEAKLHRKPGAAPCGFVRFSTPAEADIAVTTLAPSGRYTVKFADDRGSKRTHQAAFQEVAGTWGVQGLQAAPW